MSRSVRAGIALLLACLLILAGCSVGSVVGSAGGGTDRLRIMVPNVPGGGYDVTARTAVSIAERSGIADDRIAVFNLAGDQGMVALSRLLNESGNGRLAMMMGLGVVGATIATGSSLPGHRRDPDRPTADRSRRRCWCRPIRGIGTSPT